MKVYHWPIGIPILRQARVLRVLAGAPDFSQTLRYKKKMMMWTLPPLSSGLSSAPGPPEAVVGYCLMTFVIRNGLQALGLGQATYLNYVSSLTKNWALPSQMEAQVRPFVSVDLEILMYSLPVIPSFWFFDYDVSMTVIEFWPCMNQVHGFARAWASWIAANGGVSSVSSSTYLDKAEPFAREFLASGGQLAGAGGGAAGSGGARPENAFQGIVVLLDSPKEVAQELQAALAATHLFDSVSLPPFGKHLVAQGTVVWLGEGQAPPKQLKQFAEAAAPFLFLAVQRLGPPGGAERMSGGADGQAAKRQAGSQLSKSKPLEAALKGTLQLQYPESFLFPFDPHWTHQDTSHLLCSMIPIRDKASTRRCPKAKVLGGHTPSDDAGGGCG